MIRIALIGCKNATDDYGQVASRLQGARFAAVVDSQGTLAGHTAEALEYRDGTLFHIMTKGIGKMPSYAQQLDSEERWKIAQYVRALQRSASPKPEDLAP